MEQWVTEETSAPLNPSIQSTTLPHYNDGEFRMVQLIDGDIVIAEILSEHGNARAKFSAETILFQDGIDIKLVKCKTGEGKIIFAFEPPSIVGFIEKKAMLPGQSL